MPPEWLSALFAGAAIIISALTWFRSKGLQQEQNKLLQDQNDLQRRIVELEEAQDSRATLIARPERSSSLSVPNLVIENLGPGVAREVEISIDGQVYQYDLYIRDAEYKDGVLRPKDLSLNSQKTSMISKTIGARNRTVIRILNLQDLSLPKHIKLTWQDSTGKHRQYESDLDFQDVIQ